MGESSELDDGVPSELSDTDKVLRTMTGLKFDISQVKGELKVDIGQVNVGQVKRNSRLM